MKRAKGDIGRLSGHMPFQTGRNTLEKPKDQIAARRPRGDTATSSRRQPDNSRAPLSSNSRKGTLEQQSKISFESGLHAIRDAGQTKQATTKRRASTSQTTLPPSSVPNSMSGRRTKRHTDSPATLAQGRQASAFNSGPRPTTRAYQEIHDVSDSPSPPASPSHKQSPYFDTASQSPTAGIGTAATNGKTSRGGRAPQENGHGRATSAENSDYAQDERIPRRGTYLPDQIRQDTDGEEVYRGYSASSSKKVGIVRRMKGKDPPKVGHPRSFPLQTANFQGPSNAPIPSSNVKGPAKAQAADVAYARVFEHDIHIPAIRIYARDPAITLERSRGARTAKLDLPWASVKGVRVCTGPQHPLLIVTIAADPMGGSKNQQFLEDLDSFLDGQRE